MKRLLPIISLIPLLCITYGCRKKAEETDLRDNTNIAGHRVFSSFKSDNALGHELTVKYQKLFALVNEMQFDEALNYADNLRIEYEKLFNKDMKQYSFQTEDDYKEFAKTNNDAIQWVDWTYKECLQMQAYIEVERGNYPNALDLLEKIEKLAPISAGTLGEKGFVLIKMQNPSEALNTFDKMLAMSLKYPSQKPNNAASLRGRGTALIELGRLQEAEEAFNKSLIIEPNNHVALNELAYIKSIKK